MAAESTTQALLQQFFGTTLHQVDDTVLYGYTPFMVRPVADETESPFAGKFTDITMLLIAGGRERTAAEYQALLAQAEFRLTKIVPTLSPASVIEAVPA
jgi:hypothetical protein